MIQKEGSSVGLTKNIIWPDRYQRVEHQGKTLPYKVIRGDYGVMMHELYRKNLEAIRSKSPETAEQFDKLVMTNINLVPTRSGNLSGAVWDVEKQAWVQLANLEDPKAEAVNDVKSIYTPNSKIFVLIGFGLGYLAVEFAKLLRPYQRMAIFEHSPSVFKAAMHCVDISEVLGDKRIDTFIGDNLEVNVEQWFLGLQSHEKFHIAAPIRSGFTLMADTKYYDNLVGRTIDMLRYHAVGLATWQQFGAHIGDNDINNIPEYFASPGINELKGIWEGKPAICVAAGPSLKKNLHYLMDPEVRKRCVVLCVGTVYGLLRSMGIVPDIVTSIDFQRLNWTDQFRLFPQDRRTALVYLHSVYPQVPRRWPGPKFVARNSSDTTEWLYQFDEHKASAGQVQTVAHLNVVVALEMGANPIILLGQDLSMPPNEHHAPGAMAQDTTPEQAPDACVNAEDIYGNHVSTRHSFLSMRTVFTQIFRGSPQTQFINATEGGLHIDGSVDMPMARVVHDYILPANVDQSSSQFIHDVFHNYKPKAKWGEFLKEVDDVLSNLQSMYDVSRRIMDLLIDNQVGRIPVEMIKEAETAFSKHGLAMALVCVRRFDVVQCVSEIVPNGDGVTEEDLYKFSQNRIVTIARAIVDEYKNIERNIRTMKNRVIDLMEMFTGGVTEPSYRKALRYLARQSYLPMEYMLGNMLSEMNDSLYIRNDMKLFLKLQARLSYHMQEYHTTISILEMYGLHRKLLDRCRSYVDRNHSRMLSFILPYLENGARQVGGVHIDTSTQTLTCNGPTTDAVSA